MRYAIAFVMTILIAGSAQSQQNSLYMDNMQKALDNLFQASEPQELLEAVNFLERIGKKEPAKWHPRYYAAYGNIQISMRTSAAEEKDRYLDEALSLVQALNKIDPGNAEFLTLEGFIHMMRIPIDPGNRGPQYSGKSFQALQTAVNLDPENPRAHLVLANMQLGTSRFFGQGIEESCQTLQNAIQLFQNQKKKHPLDPDWGMDWAMSLQDDCPLTTK